MLRDLLEDMCWTVSQLNDYVADLFNQDEHLKSVLIRGEVSSYRPNLSGHLYFTLKDENAQVRCVMFKGHAVGLHFKLENGIKVKAFGSVSLYKRDGQYQVNLSSMEREEELGDLYREYLLRKERLEKEGLYDEDHKKPLPVFPRCIGVVTSEMGAVIRDIINVASRRNPGAHILLYPAKVQGEGAEEELVKGLQYLDGIEDVDVIILGRGGGSMEDLFAFNDEGLARAIYAAKTPVISAVGHETDFSICDFVADVRAATPSEAAELATADMLNVKRMVRQLMERGENTLRYQMHIFIDRVQKNMKSAAMERPVYLRNEMVQRLDYAIRTGMKNIHATFVMYQNRLTVERNSLHTLNPKAVLRRGYTAVMEEGTHKAITSVWDITMGQSVRVLFQDGDADAVFSGRKRGDG